MTPCEKLGYRVGDKFEVVRSVHGGDHKATVKLKCDDESICPLFECKDGVARYYNIRTDVKKISTLTKSKQWLADAIHNHGAGWPDGAKWACQDGLLGIVTFSFNIKPARKGLIWDDVNFMNSPIRGHKPQPNWHQTVLSRDEYFSAYPEVEKPEPDYSPVGHCKCVSDPVTQQPDTLDTLMKRWEDAKVSVQQAHDAVAAELERRGWSEPAVLDITDWRDLDVEDVIWVGEPSRKGSHAAGQCKIIGIDSDDSEQPLEVEFEDRCTTWPEIHKRTWKFIRRP